MCPVLSCPVLGYFGGKIYGETQSGSQKRRLTTKLCSCVRACVGGQTDSIRAAAALKAQDVMGFYHGHEYGQTPGVLPQGGALGYFWWQAGALFGAMVDYFWYTADGRWNEVVCDSLVWQGGENRDYMPLNVSLTIGNDDQVSFFFFSSLFSAFAAAAAAAKRLRAAGHICAS